MDMNTTQKLKEWTAMNMPQVQEGLTVKFEASLREPQGCEKVWNAGIPFLNIYFIMRIYWLNEPVKCYYIQI